MSLVKEQSLNLICGAPASGKSHLIKYIVSTQIKKTFDWVYVFTRTPTDYEFIKEEWVNPMYSDETIKKIMDFQTENKDKRLLLIFDDILGAINVNSGVFTELITRYRHYRLTIIFSAQYVNKVPPVFRECCMCCIVFRLTTKNAVQSTFESFASNYFKNEREFNDWQFKNLEEHVFLKIDLQAKSQKFADVFKTAKCPKTIKKFLIK
jgi:hypothetical protein